MIASIASRLVGLVAGPARQNAYGSLLILASQRVSRFAVVVAAASLLEPASFASFAVALALTDLIRGTLQAFDVGAVRQLSRGEAAVDVVAVSMDAKTLAGAVGLAAMLATAVIVYDVSTTGLVAIAGAGVLLAGYGSSLLVERQAALALRGVSTRVSLAGVAGATVAIVLGWVFRDAISMIAGLSIADGLSLAVVAGGHRWRIPNWPKARRQIQDAGSLLMMQLAYIGQLRVGTLVLGAAGASLAVAEYTAASRIAEGLIVFATALSASSLPMIGLAHARAERADRTRIFERSYRTALWIVAPAVATLAVAAPVWVAVLFHKYPDAGMPLGIVGFGVIFFFANSQTTALLNATHHDRAATQSAAAGLVASFVASVLLIPLGAIGAAWARVAGEGVRLLVETAASVAHLGVELRRVLKPWIEISPILLASALAVAAGWRAPYVWVAAGIAIAGSIPLVTATLRSRAPDQTSG